MKDHTDREVTRPARAAPPAIAEPGPRRGVDQTRPPGDPSTHKHDMEPPTKPGHGADTTGPDGVHRACITIGRPPC